MEVILIHLEANRMKTDYTLVKALGLEPGDTVIAPKSDFNIVQHYALYLGKGHDGKHYMCENAYGLGVKLTQVESFFSEYSQITKVNKFIGNVWQRKEVVQSALLRLRKPYDLFNYNCEHFVNDVLLKKPTSIQAANAVSLIGLAIVAVLVLRN
ncbi:lecithin retinol acyltransferase family protein [Rufibacter sp. LB8]|uniref:lecithin retinol acyltransferase family protein n=1 Tax=Rufibacter sp. LB8 TaxID=2777781 RepID=UPI00178C67AA|nr:lecithin retinol acyltransferase family protein [Rufibacter sp. LB8]